MHDLLMPYLSSLIIAIVVAFISVQLAMFRFRKDKWWERKHDSYSKLLSVLHRMKRYGDSFYDGLLSLEGPSTEEKAERKAEWESVSKDYDEIRDLADFDLSKEAITILDEYEQERKEAKTNPDIVELVEQYIAATQKCLQRIKAAAKKDLGV